MKELTKILGLLSLVLLVSCESGSPNMEDLGDCINGDQEKCQKIADDTPVTPEELTEEEEEEEEEVIAPLTLEDLTGIKLGSTWFERDTDSIDPMFRYKTATETISLWFYEGTHIFYIERNDLNGNYDYSTGFEGFNTYQQWSFDNNDLRMNETGMEISLIPGTVVQPPTVTPPRTTFTMSEVTSVEWNNETITFKQSGSVNGNDYRQFEIGKSGSLVRLTFIENEGVWVKEGNATGVLKSFEIDGLELLIDGTLINFSL